MKYDKYNLINLVKADLINYPCPQCNVGSFVYKDLKYLDGGPITVKVHCSKCKKEQMIKFHVQVV